MTGASAKTGDAHGRHGSARATHARTASATDVLTFWFGQDAAAPLSLVSTPRLLSRLPYWGGKWAQRVRDVEGDMRARYSDAVAGAREGRYDAWANTPDGAMALLLLLDQFPRNIFRGTPDAFASDTAALALARTIQTRGFDQGYLPVARAFVLLPFVHQEDLACQDHAVRGMWRLVRVAPGVQRMIVAAELVSAIRHRQAIARFGRFPHRNEVLGRVSSPAEASFLRQPLTRF